MLDLLVIGAGLAGLMAAHTAAEAGLNVRVVNKGLGSMHWSAGTIDLFGYAPHATKKPVRDPAEMIVAHIKRHPDHPYALVPGPVREAALDAFRALTETIGLPYGGSAENGRNLLLPSPAGAARPTYLAPAAQLAGDLSRPDPILIVGLQGMRDFFPDLVAGNLNKLGHRARAAFLPLTLITDRRDATPVTLATALDDPARRSALGRALQRLVQRGERIGLPAVLGMKDHPQTMAELEHLAGAPIFEIPTLPPSVPGMRLYRAMRDHLLTRGVRVETAMEIIDSDATARHNGSAGSVNWVASETSARPLKHRARAYLLATGGILGGGFDSDHTGKVWETIFDLPISVPQERHNWFAGSFLTHDGHPVFSGGVVVDDTLQPVADGSKLYDNLWAAGHLLANADPILERSMEGIAIITGVAAATALIKELDHAH